MILTIQTSHNDLLLPDGLEEFRWILQPASKDLSVSIFILDAELNDGTPYIYQDIQQKIGAEEGGWSMEWAEFTRFTESLHDVSDILLACYRQDAGHPVKGSFDELLVWSYAAFEIFDSTVARFSCTDSEILTRARNSFGDRVVDQIP